MGDLDLTLFLGESFYTNHGWGEKLVFFSSESETGD